MLSGAHGGLLSHTGAFCPVHQCPNSSEATSWETAWETPQCPRRAAQRPPALGRPNVGVWARLARHRVRRARYRGRRFRSVLRFVIWLPRAHRRLQLSTMGVRRMCGVFIAKGLLAPPLLATTPYDYCYIHIVGRCGRRWATHIHLNGSTSSISEGEWSPLISGFDNGSRHLHQTYPDKLGH